jgi:lipopolysaccharide/colanic/teichoic acid biosynthesis glycosyltransferase
VAPPPEAQPHEGETLAERYSRMAHEGWRPAGVDLALRGFDVVIAAVALLVLSPLLALVWAVVRLESRGPAVYRGLRVGKAGRVFTMFKFRTLRVDAETRLGPYLGAELTRLTEGETTRVGRRLRAAHLDELPQLFNVIAGDMSIVGPRPIRPAFFEQLCEEIPQYWQRLVVAPGMTGFAQLRMTREMTWEEKLAHDLEYIADRSPRLYLGVIAETAAAIPRRARAG